MPILLLFIALIAPRLVLLVLWFFTAWPHALFHTLLVPVLGLLLLPTTLLWYMIVMHWFGGHWNAVPVIGMVVALLVDTSPAHGRRWG